MITTTPRERRWLPALCRALAGPALGAALLAGVAAADGTTRANADGSDPSGQFEVSPRAVPGDGFAGAITFSVIGDAPYGDAENAIFLQQLADHNRYSRAAFVAHVGDIFSSSTPCTEDRYEQTAAWLRTLDVPVFIVPGDNEWVDCPDDNQAWAYWSTYLLGLEQSFCGVPAVQRQSIRPENFAFVQSGVLFVGVNVVAGAPTESMVESAAWVEEQLRSHRAAVRAAVVFSQAGPSSSRAAFFDPFVLDVVDFGKPVLLAHGDGHSWQYESPYLVPNLTRVQIERTTSPPVHITVTRESARPFLTERNPWPAGTPEFDSVPCVDAGFSQTVALGSTYLFGSARDDALAGPLSIGWSQRSGPGLATFGAPGAPTTTVAFDRQGSYVLQMEAFDGFYRERDTLTVVVADPATVPRVQDDAGFTAEDNLLVVPAPGVLGNDSHGGSLPLTASLLVGPTSGTLALSANGSYTYRPDLDWFGTDTFYYQAKDPNGAIGIGLVTLQVAPVNDPPVALPETFSTMVGQPIVQAAPGILANDRDPDGDLLTVSLEGDVANGTLLFGSDGSFTYTPQVDFIGLDSFTYQLSDGTMSSFASVTLSVSPIVLGTAPLADAYVRSSNPSNNYGSANFLRVEQDRTNYVSYLKFAVGGTGVSVRRARLRLYATDGGPDGGEVHLVSNNYQGTSTPWTESGLTWANAPSMAAFPLASVGSVSNNSWVEWDVTAAVGGDGTYSFGIQNGATNPVEYSSKEGSKPPELIVETDLPNAPPVVGNDSYSTPEDSVLVVPAPGVLANDSDDPRDVLSAVLLTGPATGSLDFAADGSFTYTPAADFHGNVGFTYRAQDGRGGASTGNVTVVVEPVNDLPVAGDDAFATPEDSTLVAGTPGVLGNDVDVDGQPLVVSLQTGPTHGTLGLAADGSFTYTPAANYHGPDSFVYQVSDGAGGSDTATANLTVSAVNDVPVAAADSFAVDEEGALDVDAPGILANDADADGDILRATLRRTTPNGDLVLNVDGSFSYTPADDFHGVDSFDYAVQDGNGGSDSTTVTIRVRPLNDPPVAANDTYNVAEDSVLTVAAPGVLGNDADTDGDSLVASVDTPPGAGTLVLAADGSFTYTPAANFHGSDSFQYLLSDGQGGSDTGTVQLTILPAADPPVAADDAYGTNEDVALVVPAPGVLGNDSDADGDSLAAAVQSGPAQGTLVLAADGSFTYTPASDFNGSDSFTYTAADGHGGDAVGIVNITVQAVNDAPVAVAEAYGTNEDIPLQVATPGVLGNDGDPDGDVLTAVVATGPANGALLLNGDGSFTYTPSPDWSGSDSFMYRVVDGAGGADSVSVGLSVAAVQDAPTALGDTLGTDEDMALVVGAPGVLGNDSDPDGDSLSASLVSPPLHGALALAADGSCTYTPAADWYGTDSFVYGVADGFGGTDTGTVTLVVAAVNDAPVAIADSFATMEDVPLVVTAPGILGNDRDKEGQGLTAGLETPPAQGSLVLSVAGGFTYTPGADFHGADAFTYVADDGNGGSDTTTVVLAITAVPDPPVGNADTYAIEVDSTLVVAAPGVLANDTDADGDALSAAVAVSPLHGALALDAAGGFSYTPESAYAGIDSFAYEVSDGNGGIDTAWARIAVDSTSAMTAQGRPLAPVKDTHALDEENGAATAAATTDSTEAGPGSIGRDAMAAADTSAMAGATKEIAAASEQPAPLGAATLRVRPNPFNASTVIEYRLYAAAPVEIWIHDVRGQRVCRLVGAEQGPGLHQTVWNGRSEAGQAVPSGVYFLRLRIAGHAFTSRLVLIE